MGHSINLTRVPRAGVSVLAATLRIGGAGLTDLAQILETLTGTGKRKSAKSATTSRRAAEERQEPARASSVASNGDAPGTSGVISGSPQSSDWASTPDPTRTPPPPAGVSDLPVSLDLDVPSHVDEEAVLVAEFADQGAEDGAGAHVHVQEPWNRYRSMKASEIVDRLVAEPDGVLSLVLLYEQAHRARSTVLRAAERELSRRGGKQPS